MATNFIQPGDLLTVPAPADVDSGEGVRVGVLFGVAQHDAVSGAQVTIATTGVHSLPKAPSQAWTVGAAVYWDHDAADGAVATTATTAGNILIGVAVAAVGSGAGEIVGKVRLNGAAPAAATA